MAKALAQAGRFSEAEEVARSLQYKSWSERALSQIVAALAQAGQFSQAKALAYSLEIDGYRGEALSQLAEALALANRHDEASAILPEAVATMQAAIKAAQEAAAEEWD